MRAIQIAATLAVLLVLAVGAADASAQTPKDDKSAAVPDKGRPALPGADECPVKPPLDRNGKQIWKEPERWAWNKICLGAKADFNRRYRRTLDPKKKDGWDKKRLVSPSFLQTILLYDPWHGAIGRRGVWIIGAWFRKKIDLENARIDFEVRLQRTRFEKSVQFTGVTTQGLLSFGGSYFARGLFLNRATIGGVLSLIGCKVAGKLQMDKLDVASSLFMRGGAEFADVWLTGAKIGDQLAMIGSKFTGKLNMDSAVVGGSLLMRSTERHRAEFTAIDLRSAKIAGQLDMVGAKVSGKLTLDSTVLGASLLMRSTERHRAEFAAIDLRGAKIGGHLDMAGAKVSGKLTLDSAVVGASLLMRSTERHRAEFAAIDLRGAKIAGQLDMVGAKVSGKLTLDSAVVGTSLLMRSTKRHRAEFAAIDLRSAKIGAQLSMIDSKFTGTLNMDSISVGGDLFMRGAEFENKINLVFAKISSNLDLRGATLGVLDLSGTEIEGELRLQTGKTKMKWGKNSELVLRNTSAGAFQDGGTWPEKIEVDGFTYKRLGGFEAEPGYLMSKRPVGTWIIWLKRDKSFTPQQYEQLAKVLRESGQDDKADDVLFAGKERERDQLWKDRLWGSWVWSSLKLALIGHGYRIYWALGWVVALILFGACVFSDTRESMNKGMLYGLAYSLDMLLPIIHLREKHQEIDFGGGFRPARYYFYFHQLMGYVLASFLIAGLSGLTQ